ncbi:MAG: nucleolar RNA-binding Nop10p family protein [Candidatus Micrarchaeota archaeon]
MRKCGICKVYTFKELHCNSLTASAHPVRFNPNERYAEQRRKTKNLGG